MQVTEQPEDTSVPTYNYPITPLVEAMKMPANSIICNIQQHTTFFDYSKKILKHSSIIYLQISIASSVTARSN